MVLREWIAEEGRGAIMRLMRETGLSYPTVLSARDGHSVRKATAVLISEATGGDVTAASILGVAGDA